MKSFLILLMLCSFLTFNLAKSDTPETIWETSISIPDSLNFPSPFYTLIGSDFIVYSYSLNKNIGLFSVYELISLDLTGKFKWKRQIIFPENDPELFYLNGMFLMNNEDIVVNYRNLAVIASASNKMDIYSKNDGSLISSAIVDTSKFDFSPNYKFISFNDNFYSFGREADKDTVHKLVQFDKDYNIKRIIPVDTRKTGLTVFDNSIKLIRNNNDNTFTSLHNYGNQLISNIVMNFNDMGIINWAVELKNPYIDSAEIYHLVLDKNGYITGGLLIDNNIQHFVSAKISSTGEVKWYEPIAIDSTFVLAGIQSLKDEKLAFFGSKNYIDTKIFETIRVIYILDKDRHILNKFEWRINNNSSYIGTVNELPNSNLIIAGINYSTSSIFISEVKPNISSINKNNNQIRTFSLYPNPAGNYITLSESDTKLYTGYEIYDISGRLLQKAVLDDYRIDISLLERGSYYLRLLSPSGIATAGFLKME